MALPESGASERREPTDLSVGAVVWTAAGTAGFLLLSLAALWVFWKAEDGPRSYPLPPTYGPPALQSDTAGDLRDHLTAQRAARDGYAWADREHGLVGIPVSRAMELLAARGAAAWAPLGPPPHAAGAGRR